MPAANPGGRTRSHPRLPCPASRHLLVSQSHRKPLSGVRSHPLLHLFSPRGFGSCVEIQSRWFGGFRARPGPGSLSSDASLANSAQSDTVVSANGFFRARVHIGRRITTAVDLSMAVLACLFRRVSENLPDNLLYVVLSGGFPFDSTGHLGYTDSLLTDGTPTTNTAKTASLPTDFGGRIH